MRTLTFILILLTTGVCYGQWAYKGLGHLTTYHLTLDKDTIYAGTSDGIYKKYAHSTDTNWTAVSFQGFKVISTMFLDSQRMVSIFESDTNTHTHFLSISPDRGASNSMFYNSSSVMWFHGGKFLAHVGADTIYALSHGVVTYDGGQNWQSLSTGGLVVCVDPQHSNEAYIGSTTMISSVVLHHSADYGATWNFLPVTGFYAGDNNILNMAMRGDYMYATGQGVINRRNRWANQWTQLYLPDHVSEWLMNYTALDISPANDDYIYVSGGLGGDPNLQNSHVRLLISTNKGNTWDSLKYDPATRPQYAINNMTVQRHQQNDVIWLGGTGVFTYTKAAPVSVPKAENLLDEIIVYPNPVTDKMQLHISGHKGERVEVRVTNALGQQVHKGNYSAGDIAIHTQKWAIGYYQCTVILDGVSKTVKLVKM